MILHFPYHDDNNDMAESATAATTQQAIRNVAHGPPRFRTNEAAMAAMAKKQVPTWNRLRSKPGWYSKQVHLLRGLRPREARVPPLAQGMHHLREGRTSSSGVLVKGESATSNGKETPAAKKTAKLATPELPYAAALTATAPLWYCQECGEAVRSQLAKCPVKGCAGKKPTQAPSQDPGLQLLSKNMRNKVQQVEDPPPAEEAEEDEVMKEGDSPSELTKLINIKYAYTNNGLDVPQTLFDQIDAIRKKIMPSAAPQTQEEKVTKIETERDVATERIRLIKKETTDMTKARAELEAAEEAVRKGAEMRALKIKETEEA